MELVSLERRKKPKTLSGIETTSANLLKVFCESRKKPKTLSGIETTRVLIRILPMLPPEKT